MRPERCEEVRIYAARFTLASRTKRGWSNAIVPSCAANAPRKVAEVAYAKCDSVKGGGSLTPVNMLEKPRKLIDEWSDFCH